MKKYLISIEKQDGIRLQKFYQQPSFKPHQHAFVQFGVIGKNLTVEQYFNLAVAQQFIPLSPGELGCSLSHLEALQDFLKSGEDIAIIFEDDVIAPQYFDLEAFEQQLDEIKLKPHFFLSLGGIEQKLNNRVYGRFEAFKLLGRNILKLHPASLDRLSGAYAYCLDREMAKTLIQYHEKIRVYDHWDDLYAMNASIHFYATHIFDHPEITEQKATLSHIELERLRLNQNRKAIKPWYIKLKQSILKRWLKCFYHAYRSN